MLIRDHSIAYLNLQDKSGMKFDSGNYITEILNYRDKIFEYKKRNSNDNILFKADNINPNDSYFAHYTSLESEIIEAYRITFFTVIKSNDSSIFEFLCYK